MRRTSMEQLIQEWRASLPKFREMTEKFYAKEVSSPKKNRNLSQTW